MNYRIALLLLICRLSYSQVTKAVYYNSIDNTIFLFSKNKQITLDSVVSFVQNKYGSNEDKVRAYYTWIALNISYDAERLKAYKESLGFVQRDSSQAAEFVFRSKKAVCEGFSKLMKKFCEASSIPCQVVVGYTKMSTGEVVYDILHVWNAVKADSSWHLLDVTWSNGFVGPDGSYYKHFSDKYFFNRPDFFLRDHLPLDPLWQLSNEPVSKSYFFGTDTSKKYFSPASFNYSDSIAFYQKQNPDIQNYLDNIHYYAFDPANEQYLKNADGVIYNQVVEIYNASLLIFDEYKIFYFKKFSKEKTAGNCKKAKAMLESCRDKSMQVLAFLNSRKALTTEFSGRFDNIRKNVANNLNLVKEHLNYVSQLQKKTARKNK